MPIFETMIFGNWHVTDDSIIWKGTGFHRFVLSRDGLNKTRRNDANDAVYYDWILLATDEDWLTQNDLYDLNYAFVYAMAKYNLDYNYEIFDATLAEQYDQFDREDDEDVDF